MNVSLDVCSKSLNKREEELCGDTVEIVKTADADIIHSVRWYGKRCKGQYLIHIDHQDSRYNAEKRRDH